MPDRNSDEPANKRIEPRIGINLGDVVIDGDDIQGDGVNVAARLEGMAEPGRIRVRMPIVLPFSATGRSQLGNPSLAYGQLGGGSPTAIMEPEKLFEWQMVGDTR